jgi:hypothetical protein
VFAGPAEQAAQGADFEPARQPAASLVERARQGRRRRRQERFGRQAAEKALPRIARAKVEEPRETGPGPNVIECTTFAPPSAAAGDALLVQVFVHTPRQRESAAALAQEFDLDAERRGFANLEIEIGRGTQLTFDLAMPGLLVDERMQTLVWRGHPASAQFGVQVPDDHKAGVVIGTVTVSVGEAPIGHIKFKVEISREKAARREPAPAGDDARHYAMAFISYASRDRDEVLRRVQMLSPLGIRYFQDVLDLDPGDRWEAKLYEHIDQCDLFLLFWSSAAKASEWVKREVEYAVARKGDDDLAPPEIRPIVIEGPPIIPPWEDLSHLHFNDLLIYLIGAE